MNAEVDVKLGHKIGDFFLPQLQNAKSRLWIMSPWVATKYMELAINKKNAGVNVRVTTSNNWVNGQKEALSRLIETQTKITKEENKYLKYIGIGLTILGIFLIKSTDGMSLYICLLGFILFILSRKHSETHWISKLDEGNLTIPRYNPYNLVHAKIYIVDDMVIMGSANLTGNGLNHHTEVMAIIKNYEIAQKLIDDMKRIQEISGLPSVSFEEVGRDIEIIEPAHNQYHRRR
jgi:phosphatidylserine/phosphatidylglycerophosphate/cardiolipin synthase-like enzyme